MRFLSRNILNYTPVQGRARIDFLKHPNLRTLISTMIYIVAAYFLFDLIVRYWGEVRPALISNPNYYSLIMSIILKVFFYFWMALISRYILSFFDTNIKYLVVFKIILLPQLVNYIPGKILSYANLFHLAGSAGISSKNMISFIGVNQIITVLLSLLFGSVTVFFLPSLGEYLKFAPALFVAGIFLIHPSIFNRVSAGAFKLFKKMPVTFHAKTRGMVSILSLTLVGYAAEGLSFSFFLLTFADINSSIFIMSIFLFSLARIIGYLSLIFPAGLGVREGVIIYALKTFLTLNVAMFLSAGYRIIEIAILAVLSLFCLTIKVTLPEEKFGKA